MKTLFSIIFILACLAVGAQHTVTLNNGKLMPGKITRLDDQTISILASDSSGMYSYPLAMVEKYDLGSDKPLAKPIVEKTPGDEMIKFSKHMYTGIVLTLIGTGTAMFASTMDSEKEAVTYIGGAIVLLGTIFELESISHVAKAGRKLNLITNQSGLGLSMKIGK